MTKKILFLLAFIPSVLFAQHTIKGKLTPADKFEFAILYKVTPTTSLYVGNAEVSDTGSFEFKLDSTNTKGMYRIVYALPQEENNFDVIYSGEEDIDLEFDLEKGIRYKSSKDNMLLTAYKNAIGSINGKMRQMYANGNKPSDKEFKSIFKALNDAQNEFEDAAKGTQALHFIKASKPYIAKEYEDVGTLVSNLKTHYFDNIDFSDEVLQNSNFLIESCYNYILSYRDKNNLNGSLKNNIDDVVKSIGNNTTIKKVILKVFWSQFSGGKNESVANHVGKYLLPILDAKKDKEYIDKVTYFKNASLGEKAPNFSYEIEDTKNDKMVAKSLHKLDDAKRYLVLFWSSGCSHCLEELPKLKDYLKTLKEGDIKVLAVGLEDERGPWVNEITRHPGFTHIYGEGKWDNPIGDAYDIHATPGFFLLNEDKIIIAKPEDTAELKSYLDKNPIE